MTAAVFSDRIGDRVAPGAACHGTLSAAAAAGSGRRLWTRWALSRLIAFCVLLVVSPHLSAGGYVMGDINNYQHWSTLLWHGSLPYRQWKLEYPPGALLVSLLPSLSAAAYHLEFLALALLADAVAFQALRRSRRHWGIISWLFVPLLLGPTYLARLDIFVAAAIVCSIVAVERHRPGLAATLLTVAGLIKLWPFVVLAFLIVALGRKRALRAAVASVATIAVFVLPVLAYGGTVGGLMWSLKFQLSRGIEIESVPAAGSYLWHLLVGHVRVVHAFGSFQLFGGYTTWLGAVSSVAMLTGLALVTWRCRRPVSVHATGWFALGVIAAMIMTSKVLSPQYMIWAAAAVAVVIDRSSRPRRLLLVTAAALLTTQALFPFAFTSLRTGGLVGSVTSLVHAAAILAFGIVVWREMGGARISGNLSRSGDGVQNLAQPSGSWPLIPV